MHEGVGVVYYIWGVDLMRVVGILCVCFRYGDAFPSARGLVDVRVKADIQRYVITSSLSIFVLRGDTNKLVVCMHAQQTPTLLSEGCPVENNLCKTFEFMSTFTLCNKIFAI